MGSGDTVTGGSIHLTPLLPSDLKPLAALERGCFTVPWSEASLAYAIGEERNITVAARDETGRILGYGIACCLFEDCEILNLAVLPSERRRGIGRSLLRVLLSGGKKRGCERALLEVRETNSAARRLYESEGFGAVGRREKYYRFPTEDAIRMEKRL